jgi:hypothetical protein
MKESAFFHSAPVPKIQVAKTARLQQLNFLARVQRRDNFYAAVLYSRKKQQIPFKCAIQLQ